MGFECKLDLFELDELSLTKCCARVHTSQELVQSLDEVSAHISPFEILNLVQNKLLPIVLSHFMSFMFSIVFRVAMKL